MNVVWIILAIVALTRNGQIEAKPTKHERLKRNAYRSKTHLWPRATIPYTLDDAYSFTERKVIEGAMADIHSVSCIQFIEYSGQKAYVTIVKEKGCRAVVGYIGRKQKLTLGYGCIWKARVLHELLHVLGFFHEHTRPDRDDYVIINEENIRTSALDNFRKRDPSKVTTFDLPYDYLSVLHYHDREFAIDRKNKTLEPRKVGVEIIRPTSLSFLDVMKLNRLYSCELKEEGSGLSEIEDNFIKV